MENKVAKILSLVGTHKEIAEECRVMPIAVYRWLRANSIPSRHLPGVLRVARRNKTSVTADDLLKAHEKISPSNERLKSASLPDGILPADKDRDHGADFQGQESQTGRA